MSASYPTSTKSFSTKTNGSSIAASHVNDLQDEVVAIETDLRAGLSAARGGTGAVTLAAHGVVIGNGTSAVAVTGAGTAGQALVSNGASADPTFQSILASIVNEFRLSLTSGTSVTSADVTAATTLYLTPHSGRRMTVFDGSGNATTLTSAEISIAIPATTSQLYDVFVYNNSGVLALELLAWTNDTTRATAIVKNGAIDAAGVWTKSGDTTRRYVGSMRTTAVSGQTEDSAPNRFVYNQFNEKQRTLGKYNTGNYTYTTATWREAGGSTTHRVNFIIGVAERAVTLEAISFASNGTSSVNVGGAVGLDSTTAPTPSSQRNAGGVAVGTSMGLALPSSVETIAAVGFHFASQLEYSAASGTTTWYDNAFVTGQQAGIGGIVWA